jgi:hypothetical protein
MKYFLFENSSNRKIVGRIWPQSEGVYLTSVESPNFIDNAVPAYSKIDRDVERPMARLRKKSVKLTDFLSIVGMGFVNNFLLSDRLKQIIEQSRSMGFQFLDTKVFNFSGNEKYTYWILNTYLFFPEYVDYSQSKLCTDSFDGKEKEWIHCESYEDYQQKCSLYAPRKIYLDKIAFLEREIECDFFALNNTYGAISYFVSEKLKDAIESAGCTGMEFINPAEVYP